MPERGRADPRRRRGAPAGELGRWPAASSLFGATGYTGRLMAEALAERGLRPRARGPQRGASSRSWRASSAATSTRRSPTSPPAERDRARGGGRRARGTVGPFVELGRARRGGRLGRGRPLHRLHRRAAVHPRRLRALRRRRPRRRAAGMLTAFGYDWVPGNLAGALALRAAGEAATRVDTGYFITGAAGGGMSGGTRASLGGRDRRPELRLPRRRVRTERGARATRTFRVGAKQRRGSLGGQLGALRAAASRIPQLREVNAYLGWFGPASRADAGRSPRAPRSALRCPAPTALRAPPGGSSRGPPAAPTRPTRARSGSHVVGDRLRRVGTRAGRGARDRRRRVHVHRRVLAWGAERAAAGRASGSRSARAGRRLRPRRARRTAAAEAGHRRDSTAAPHGFPSPPLASGSCLAIRPRAAGCAALASAAAVALAAGAVSRRDRRRSEPERARPRAPRRAGRLAPARAQQVGQLLVSSFDGTTVPAYIARRLRAGETRA